MSNHQKQKYTKGLFIKYALTLCLCVAGCTACDVKDPAQSWLASVTVQIQKDYDELSQESQMLSLNAKQACMASDDEIDWAPVQQQWRSAMTAWERIQWVRFGPIIQNNDDWKFQFWPDKKNLVARKIQDILSTQSIVDDGVIERSSVVVQGFSALEYLLFDGAAPTEKRCQLVTSIAKRLHSNSERIALHWKDPTFISEWLNPKESDDQKDRYSVRDGEIIDALLSQMERVKGDKLGGPLGYKNRNKTPNGYFSESWRSSSSLLHIQTNLESLKALMVTDGVYGLSDYLSDQGHQALAEVLLQKINSLIQAIKGIEMPLNQAVTDAQHKMKVEAVYQGVGELNSLLKSQLAPALDVVLGFNSNDGD